MKRLLQVRVALLFILVHESSVIIRRERALRGHVDCRKRLGHEIAARHVFDDDFRKVPDKRNVVEIGLGLIRNHESTRADIHGFSIDGHGVGVNQIAVGIALGLDSGDDERLPVRSLPGLTEKSRNQCGFLVVVHTVGAVAYNMDAALAVLAEGQLRDEFIAVVVAAQRAVLRGKHGDSLHILFKICGTAEHGDINILEVSGRGIAKGLRRGSKLRKGHAETHQDLALGASVFIDFHLRSRIFLLQTSAGEQQRSGQEYVEQLFHQTNYFVVWKPPQEVICELSLSSPQYQTSYTQRV